jgi:hypothetical protein
VHGLAVRSKHHRPPANKQLILTVGYAAGSIAARRYLEERLRNGRSERTMPISETRARFIADMANDEWIGRLPRPHSDEMFDEKCEEWDRKTESFLRDGRDSSELFLFARLWNWDGDEVETLRAIIESPVCSKATALMIFWRAIPEDFFLGPLFDLPYQVDLLKLLRDIQERFLSGSFIDSDDEYDPRSEYKLEGPGAEPPDAVWRISPLMYSAITSGSGGPLPSSTRSSDP